MNSLHNHRLTSSLILSGTVDLAGIPEAPVVTCSPAFVDAFRLLLNDLYEHLEKADCLATQCAEWSAQDVDAAGELISDLVLVIRRLLAERKLQSSGDCSICASAWPCAVVTTIHAFVKDPHREFVALLNRARDDQ